MHQLRRASSNTSEEIPSRVPGLSARDEQECEVKKKRGGGVEDGDGNGVSISKREFQSEVRTY